MTPLEVAGFALLTLFGLRGSAVWSGVETGLYTVNRVRLNLRASVGDRAAVRLRDELEHPRRTLAALLINNNLFNYFGTVGLTALFSATRLSDIGVLIVNSLVLTPMLFVFGETLPKEYFRSKADTVTYRFAGLLVFVRRAQTVLLVLPLVEGFTRVVMRLFKVEPSGDIMSGRGRIAALLKEGAGHGVLSDAQTGLVDRAMTLRDARVRDEMTPWRSVRTIPLSATPAQRLALLRQADFSRYPVTGPDGAVRGVINHLDACLDPDVPNEALLKPVITLEPQLTVRRALERLSKSGAGLAVVVEPSGAHRGRPIGIVSAKDLVEPLTGRLSAW